ncbi:MAG: crotonyl-CoA carboxylase/reductase [Nocardiopsaceae bacterium]|nr:crotonyl-CoA carboxylase/reductase [Nocardiopsaceae bacterium]
MTDLADSAAADDPAAIGACPVPDRYRAAVVLAEDQRVFAGVPSSERDPRKTLHLTEVPTPEPAPGEVLIAVMASSVNYNTVWTAMFEPVSTFRFLTAFGRTSAAAARHEQPFHVVGSDAAGVVLRAGAGVTRWRPGDEIVTHCLHVGLADHAGHDDTLLDPDQRIWGYETNFGGLGELALVQATQLLPKPAHLSWEEAACLNLTLSTAYRQLVSAHGAAMKQGDRVLIWGACGGLGGYATQLVLNGGGIPVCVVSSEEKAALCRQRGAELVIDRRAFEFWDPGGRPRLKNWSRFKNAVRDLADGDPEIVFEHPGRETFGVSVLTAARGGTVVTCASTSGYEHLYDNRHLWMHVKRIVGTHSANYTEAWKANELVIRGRIHPIMSRAYPLDHIADAVSAVHANRHHGKVGVLCLAPREGMGIRDRSTRERHLHHISLFQQTTTT